MPSSMARLIQTIHILNSLEHDAIFWVPSKSGEFSIKFVYRVHQQLTYIQEAMEAAMDV